MTWPHFLTRLFGLSAESRFMLAIRKAGDDAPTITDPEVATAAARSALR